jgi:hypothetical protein
MVFSALTDFPFPESCGEEKRLYPVLLVIFHGDSSPPMLRVC